MIARWTLCRSRLLPFLFLGFVCWSADLTADDIPIQSTFPCPPRNPGDLCRNGRCINVPENCTREGDCATQDINGDGVKDWLFEVTADNGGNKMVYGCVKSGEVEGQPVGFFALTYVPAGGNPRFIGKCGFDYGQNGILLKRNLAGRFTGALWRSADLPLYGPNGKIIAEADQDNDGKQDTYVYGYAVAPNTLSILNLEDGKPSIHFVRPPHEAPFLFNDLEPLRNNLQLVLDACGCEGCHDLETTPPLCFISDLRPGPPTTLEVTATDGESGIRSISVLTLLNSKIEIPKGSGRFYQQGDLVLLPLAERHGIQLIEAEKIDQSQRSQVLLEVTNGADLIRRCDPVITLVVREAGRPERASYGEIPQAEGQITIHNGSPGLKQLEIQINGRRFASVTLADGRSVRLNASSAMLPGDSNVVTLSAHGRPGGSGVVIIHD